MKLPSFPLLPLVATAFLVLSSSLCQAQNEPDSENQGGSVAAFAWRAELPGGTFMVSLAALRHISLHEYLVQGVGKITEMTVDSGGSVAARFYAVGLPDLKTPSGVGQSVIDRAKEAFKEMRDRVDPGGMSRSVVKDYPNTTHAHTVEYLLGSPEAVRKLYENLERAWVRGRGDRIKIE